MTHSYNNQDKVPGASLHGLPCENLNWPSRSRMDLVVNHVLQSLVVGGAKEHLCVQLASSEAIEENFIATEMVAILIQEFRDFLNIDSIVEGRGITYLTFVS